MCTAAVTEAIWSQVTKNVSIDTILGSSFFPFGTLVLTEVCPITVLVLSPNAMSILSCL